MYPRCKNIVVSEDPVMEAAPEERPDTFMGPLGPVFLVILLMFGLMLAIELLAMLADAS